MEADDSLIGGESSGGLTIRGHIKGKDGVFASSLLVEMISVTGKKLSELLDEIYGKYGYAYMAEGDCKFKPAQKDALFNKIYIEKQLPEFEFEIEKVSYEDGAKVYFKTVVGLSLVSLVPNRCYVFLQRCKIRTLRNVFFNSLKTSCLYN